MDHHDDDRPGVVHPQRPQTWSSDSHHHPQQQQPQQQQSQHHRSRDDNDTSFDHLPEDHGNDNDVDDDNELTIRRKNVTKSSAIDGRAGGSSRPTSIMELFDNPTTQMTSGGGDLSGSQPQGRTRANASTGAKSSSPFNDSNDGDEEKKVAATSVDGPRSGGRDHPESSASARWSAPASPTLPTSAVADAWLQQQQQQQPPSFPPPSRSSLSPPVLSPLPHPLTSSSSARPIPVISRQRSPNPGASPPLSWGASSSSSPQNTPPSSFTTSSTNLPAQQQQQHPQRHGGHHQRNVSWNMKVDTVVLDRPKALGDRQISDFSNVSSIFQSEAAAPTEYERLPGSRNNNNNNNAVARPNGLSRGVSGTSRRKIMSSAEMIRDHLHQQSPLESEAEAYILQAIEKSDPPSRPRSESSGMADAIGGPTVLAGVPDEAILNMTLSSNPPVTVTSPSMDASVDGNGNFPSGDLTSLEGTTVTTRSHGGYQPHSGAGSATGPAPRRPPLSRPNAITLQKRQQTMEEKLCGLTSELDMIQGTTQPAHQGGKPSLVRATSEARMGHRSRAGTLESIPSDRDLLIVDDPVVSGGSAVDTFQQSTGILYRRMKKEDSDRNLLNPPVTSSSLSSLTSQPQQGGTKLDGSGLESWIKATSSRFLPGAMHKKTDDADNTKDHNDAADGGDDEELQSIQEVDEDLERASEDKHDSPTGRSDTGGSGASGSQSTRRRRLGSRRRMNQSKSQSYTEEWKLARDFMDTFKLMNRPLRLFLKGAIFYIMIPALFIAAILFHLTGNPPTGILQNGGKPINGTLLNTNGHEVDPNTPSVSWWLLFMCVRQLLMLMLALLMDLILIDFFSIRSGIMYKVFGAWTTLFVLQSRGWPFVIFFWCVFDFALLYGSARFFQHWLFWQEVIPLMNGSNPSGHIVDSLWYHRILSIAICVSAVVAVKRFIMGIFFGKKTFQQYSDKLATVMGKIILISQVAYLAQDLERQSRMKARSDHELPRESMVSRSALTEDRLGALFQTAEDGSEASPVGRSDRSLGWDDDIDNKLAPVIDPDDRHPLTGKLNASQKSRIVQLLGSWEEPTTSETTVELVSVSALLHFRRALACLRTDFPFSSSFGPAGTREDTITSSQEVYERLLLGSDDTSCLHFNVLATLGVFPDGTLDQDKLVDLIRIFRPDRDGTLSVIDFVKSIDAVYRELRLLRASVNNSTKIDKSFENIFNIIFYGLILVVVLSQLGFDPLSMFLSISGVVLAFAFMIGAASSKYFEGVLFILMRRPYEIGDGIHVSDVNNETLNIGSDCWVVKDVSLFSTTLVFVRTKEVATMSNGSLAASRIINSSRSSHASLYCLIKFPISVPYSKLKVFQDAVQTYIRNRPREWLGFTTFRVNRVVTEENFIEYMFVGTHRESWYHLGTLRDSLGSLLSFTVELSKKLDITYQKPAMPINMAMISSRSYPAAMPSLALSGSGDEPPTSPRSAAGSMDYSTDLRGLHELFAPSREYKHGHGKEHS